MLTIYVHPNGGTVSPTQSQDPPYALQQSNAPDPDGLIHTVYGYMGFSGGSLGSFVIWNTDPYGRGTYLAINDALNDLEEGTILYAIWTLSPAVPSPSSPINKVVFDDNVLIDLTQDTVTAGNLLSGITAHSASGNGITGTMTNNGSVTETISAGDTYTIPEGYHDGTGTVTATDNSAAPEPTLKSVIINGGGNTSSAYNSSVLDVGFVGNPCRYQMGGGGYSSKTFSIQGSLNNSNWSTVASWTNSSNRITGGAGTNSEYRYYRGHVNSGTASVQNSYRGLLVCIDPDSLSGSEASASANSVSQTNELMDLNPEEETI